MARLNWTPPPLDFKSQGARVEWEGGTDLAFLRISSPTIGTIEIALAGDNKARFERQVAGDRSADVGAVLDRLSHIRHDYIESVS